MLSHWNYLYFNETYEKFSPLCQEKNDVTYKYFEIIFTAIFKPDITDSNQSSLWEKVVGQVILGSASFVEEMQVHLAKGRDN